MEKLTLKEITGYLPYDLEGLIIYSDGSTDKCTLSIKNGLHGKCDINDFINGNYPIKPILYPLEMLTKTIVHNGVEIIPINYNAFKYDKESIVEFQNGFAHVDSLKYGIVRRLYEWHFDIHGLIPKGLAIDKSTLNSK